MAAHAMPDAELLDQDSRRSVRSRTPRPGEVGPTRTAEADGGERSPLSSAGGTALRPSQVPVRAAAAALASRGGEQDDADGSRRAPSEVTEVLRSPGTSLDAGTRTVMEREFGADFRPVRVHADDRAAHSARTIGADAYAAGRHIAFGPGQYQPGTQEGRRLLAHELAHVLQQQGRNEPGGDLRVGGPHTAAESEAHRAAQAVTRTTSRSGGAGAVGGGTGAGQGRDRSTGRPALAGAGPATVQRAPSTGPRVLTATEINLLKAVFGTHLDTSLVRIHENSILATGAKRTIGNTINIQGTTISNSTLIHEAAHCYQNQRGDHYVASSLFAQGLSWATSGSRSGAYDYTDEVAKKVPFDDWNSEQQAHWIEDNAQLPPSRRGAPGYP
jgi:hypothetical protein